MESLCFFDASICRSLRLIFSSRRSIAELLVLAIRGHFLLCHFVFFLMSDVENLQGAVDSVQGIVAGGKIG